jgi:hypothetical protein
MKRKFIFIFAALLILTTAELTWKALTVTTSASSRPPQQHADAEFKALQARQVGPVPEIARPEAFLGRLESDRKMLMTISFQAQNQEGIQTLITDIYNPTSPNYHKWVTPEQFADRFGRTQEEFTQATNWLKGQGFTIEQAWPNRLSITFSGPVSLVEKVFNVQMGKYHDAFENRDFISNQQRPQLPAELEYMTVSLMGLNDAYLRHHIKREQLKKIDPEVVKQMLEAKAKGGIAPNAIIGGSHILGPNDLGVVYGYTSFINSGITGQNQKIGNIIDSDVLDSDRANLRNFYGLPAINLVRKIAPGLSNPGTQFEGEAEEDVDDISVVVPNAEIDLVLVPQLDSNSLFTAESYAINTLHLAAVNESFGGCEQFNFDTSEQTLFQQAAAAGTAFFASSGDEGAECAGGTPGQNAVELPAAYDSVTAVGGTSVQGNFDSNSNLTSVSSDKIWNVPPGVRNDCNGNSTGGGAGGGGTSTMVTRPSYQTMAMGTGGVPSGTKRVEPDVALAADPDSPALGCLVGFQGGFFIGGGTSQASPLMAAMMTLVNQFKGSIQGFPNPEIYRQGFLQYNSGGPMAFTDITVGNNKTLGRPGCTSASAPGFSAGTGYDEVSGWGSPNLATFAQNFGGSGLSFSPTSGIEGDAITITANMGLAAATDVQFNGVSVNGNFVINSDTQIVANVPSAATTGTITVVTASGSPNSGSSFTTNNFTSTNKFTVKPNIDSLSPPNGAQGSAITINGAGFRTPITVKFGTILATSPQLINSQQINVNVPSTAVTSTVTVTTPDGTASSPSQFGVTPKVTSFTPTTGAVGTKVTITGNNFTNVTDVSINGFSTNGAFTVVSATSITFNVPAGASTGPISVTTTAGTGTSTTSFKVTPKITGFNPPAVLPNASVQIQGFSFTGATAVKIGTVAVTVFNVDSDSQITATVPATASTATVTVTTPGGSAVSSTMLTIIKPPTVTSLSPTMGAVGVTVTINGTNLSSVTDVEFTAAVGTVNAGAITVVSASSIKVNVPAGAVTGVISVTNAAGSANSGTFKVLPKITGLSPSQGLPNSTFNINGFSLTGATSVKIGSVAVTIFNVVNDNQISATVPASASSGTVMVTTPGGTASSPTMFTVIKPPTITSFTPTMGAVGATITINGTNLNSVTDVEFVFGGVNTNAGAITVVSATSIKVNVPAGASNGSNIMVTNAAGSFTTTTTFKVLPKITSIAPTMGLPGSSVVITGTNFTGATTVKFGATVAVFNVDSDSQITATVPATAITSSIMVTTPAGSATSPTMFTVIKAPTISSFTPTSGHAGSTLVTINGTNLNSATNVQFNGTDAGAITVVSVSQIKVTVPNGATTGKITVINPAGQATSTGTFTVN